MERIIETIMEQGKQWNAHVVQMNIENAILELPPFELSSEQFYII